MREFDFPHFVYIMKKKFVTIIKYLLFLGIGVILFWGVYGDLDLNKLKTALGNINYFWIVLSIIISIMSQVSRAIRWNMLITPMGYKPKLFNTFLSVLVLYLVNLFLPRAGEIGRCNVLSKYEKIPFTKLVGTVFVERLADLITLLFLTVIIVTTQIGKIRQIFDRNRINEIMKRFTDRTPHESGSAFSSKNILIAVGILIAAAFIIVEIRKYIKNRKQEKSVSLRKKINEIKYNIIEGIKTIGKLENKWYFIAHTFFIFLMWLFMLYVIFLAFEPTKNLSIFVGATTFLMGGLAMLLPIQGGIGPWHIMVILTLSVYNISIENGEIFALIAHSTTNLIYILLGLVALLLLLIYNNRKEQEQPVLSK